ncbi:MAG: glycoside hydrolase family 15 protein [bacterium]
MHDPRGAGHRPRTTPPIEAHGVIGNQETAAFVAPDATIDYLCFPRFDSPTVFARLLDRDRGGAFELRPLGRCARSQAWLRDTHVLVTRFAGPDGIAEITDLMPIDDRGPIRALVRRVDVREGRLRFHARCAPRFDYARRGHTALPVADGVELRPDGGATPALHLAATVPLALDGRDVTATFDLAAGESACFVLAPQPPPAPLAPRVADWITTTTARWRVWAAQIAYRGRWSEPVRRSALVLHLLTAARYGAIVAAPTFGLPEAIGGERNWDYRYSWIRDSAFAVYALTRLGHGEAARAFMRWVLDVCIPRHRGGRLQVMYAVDGRTDLTEETLSSLRGYHDSRPVRIGNGAHDQLQLDIYGPLLDAACLAAERGQPVSPEAWRALTAITDWVAAHWDQPDAGIWEIRGEPRHFLTSRVMCWVALDRALRIAAARTLPAPTHRWQSARDAIRADVFAHFWHPGRAAFVQYRGGDTLDASALLMPLVDFIAPDDPRWLSTLAAIDRELRRGPRVHRYSPRDDIDGLEGREGSFTACSFWYVECLARAGRLDEARRLFDDLLACQSPLGLLAEELGPGGHHLGNYPQALSHLALISAAHRLDVELDRDPAATPTR